jgi:MFS family permease
MLAAYQFGVLLVLHNTLQRDLGFTTTVMAVIVVSHMVAAALGYAPGYVLGRRAPSSVVAPALMLMLGAAAVMALSGTSALVIAAVLMAGFGGGAVLGAASGLTGQVGQRQGQVRLALGLAVFGGLLFGLLLGWFISTALGWRWAYLLMVPMAVPALVAAAASGVVALMRGSR